MKRHHTRSIGAVGLVVSVTLLAAACGSSSDDAAPTTTASAEAAPATTEAPAEGPQTIEVTASNYHFMGLPDTAPAGSTISLTTAETSEPHELVAVLMPADETRSVEELTSLPEAELEAMFAGEPALVTIAMPGATDTPGPVVGDGTLSESGRYLVLCTFPEGTTPEDVAKSEGPLEGENPHFTLGMVDEITIV